MNEPKPLFPTFGALANWIYHSRKLKWCLAILVCLIALLGVFNAEEYWRGKRAWDRIRRELAAQGEVVDWEALIPPPVPDDQNIFKAPNMRRWFIGRGGNEFTRRLDANSLEPFLLARNPRRGPLPVAEVVILPGDAAAPAGTADAVFSYERGGLQVLGTATAPATANSADADPAANRGAPISSSRDQLKKMVLATLGDATDAPVGFTLIGKPASEVKPIRVIVRTDKKMATNEVASWFPAALTPGHLARLSSEFIARKSGSNTFTVSLDPPPCSAADYLAWSGQFDDAFDIIREALKRPYARLGGLYDRPVEIRIPNFIALRTSAQMLAGRARCQLLLGNSAGALRELTTIHDLCRMLEARPTGSPMTLVAAMINVAIQGLSIAVVEDGLNWERWDEAQLAALQRQLGEVNLPPLVRAALSEERVGVCRTMEMTSTLDLQDFFNLGRSSNRTIWQKLKDREFLALLFFPRGWVYQNMVVTASLEEKFSAGMDRTNNRMRPAVLAAAIGDIDKTFKHFSPFTLLAAIAIPNFTRACQTTARNQTLVNQGFVVCALRRFHHAHGEYPASLEELRPQFLDAIPNDLVGGAPLKYRRRDKDHFVLYSVGWTEADYGGVPENGDWVWGIH